MYNNIQRGEVWMYRDVVVVRWWSNGGGIAVV